MCPFCADFSQSYNYDICMYVCVYVYANVCILYYIISYCIILYYIILYCIIKYHIVLYYIVLYYITLYYIILYYIRHYHVLVLKKRASYPSSQSLLPNLLWLPDPALPFRQKTMKPQSGFMIHGQYLGIDTLMRVLMWTYLIYSCSRAIISKWSIHICISKWNIIVYI